MDGIPLAAPSGNPNRAVASVEDFGTTFPAKDYKDQAGLNWRFKKDLGMVFDSFFENIEAIAIDICV